MDGDLRALGDLFPDAPIAVLGAAALEQHGIVKEPRTTDVDLAIAIGSRHADARLTEAGWTRSRHVVHRWVAPGGTPMDVVAAAPAEIERGFVELEGAGRRMSLVGFAHLFDGSGVVARAVVSGVRLASVPCVVLLKIVAVEERPSERLKDLGDIAQALDELLGVEDERRYVGPPCDRGWYQEDASAWWLARELGALCTDAERSLCAGFLERLATPRWEAELARRAPAAWRASVDEVQRKLVVVRAGFEAGCRQHS